LTIFRGEFQRVNAPNVWLTNNTGIGIKVAVIDTGIDYTHPELQTRVIGGYNSIGGDSYLDDNGHGTHVSV